MPSSSSVKNPETFGPLPLVIGVTGHRDIRPEDVPELEAIVQNIFDRLREEYPHTPIEILSPLAEGADRLVARVALRSGIRLVVPLPMPLDLYETDFDSQESLAEFRELLGRAHTQFELQIAEGSSVDDVRQSEEARGRQYGQLGAYIVRNSHALIALWNGILPQLSHGTADVVGFNLNGIPDEFSPPHSLLEPQKSDPVWHIVTPRLGNPKTEGEPLTLRMLYPSRFESPETGKMKFEEVLENTERFNKDEVGYRDELAAKREESRGYLIPPSHSATTNPAFKPALDLFATADTMAAHFAGRTHTTLKTLFAIVMAAAIIFDIYTHIYITQWLLLAAYLFLLVLTYSLVLRSRRKTYQTRYLDYRALAEGLRVGFFWRLAGIEGNIADHYLHKQQSELDWIRYALRVWHADDLHNRPRRKDHDGMRGGVDAALRYWVEDQRKYFARAAKREEKQVHRAERWAGVIVVIGIALALFQVLLQGVIDPYPGKHPIHWLLVAVALAPILAGLIIGYVEKRAHSDHAKQYERMSILFANASIHLKDLTEAGNYDRARLLLEELGREALAENGDWVLIHRDRPVEVPKA